MSSCTLRDASEYRRCSMRRMKTSGTAITTTSSVSDRVEPGEQHQHDERGDPVDHEEDGAPADEAADGADVARRAREELPGVPVVVEPDVESLELRVEVVAERGLDAVRDDPEHVPADERRRAPRRSPNTSASAGERGDSLPVTVGERAVDDRLRDLRNGDGRDRARRARRRRRRRARRGTAAGTAGRVEDCGTARIPPSDGRLTLRRVRGELPRFPRSLRR